MSPAPRAIAVTGAPGQIGTLLRERLAERGVRVVPLGRSDDWGRQRIQPLYVGVWAPAEGR